MASRAKVTEQAGRSDKRRSQNPKTPAASTREAVREIVGRYRETFERLGR
jgi:hypothetical protein